jgi:hypothetical protein
VQSSLQYSLAAQVAFLRGGHLEPMWIHRLLCPVLPRARGDKTSKIPAGSIPSVAGKIRGDGKDVPPACRQKDTLGLKGSIVREGRESKQPQQSARDPLEVWTALSTACIFRSFLLHGAL